MFFVVGDDLYPEKPDYECEGEMMVVAGTMLELRVKYPNMNRSELVPSDTNAKRNFVCNVTMEDGQVSPMFFGLGSEPPSARL